LKFDFGSLVAGKNIYWVESIAYGIAACRILVSRNDWSGSLLEYNPAADGGPWRYDDSDDTHYWNGEKCLEIMYEGNLRVDACVEADFVKHHAARCCVDPNFCSERGLTARRAAGYVLAGILSRGIHPGALPWTETNGGKTSATDSLKSVFGDCCGAFPRMKAGAFSGSVAADSPLASPLIRAAAGAVLRDARDEAVSIMGMFENQDSFDDALTGVVAEAFGIDDPTELTYW